MIMITIGKLIIDVIRCLLLRHYRSDAGEYIFLKKAGTSKKLDAFNYFYHHE